jgi:HAD superfamily hydrolase (TIGR01509 family)
MQLEIPDRDFKGYIFDCDGTLADTMPLHYKAWSRLLREYGGEFPEDLFYAWGGKPSNVIIEELNKMYGLSMPVEKAVEEKESYFEELIHETLPIEPVLEIARKMHGKVPLAVASGGYRRFVEMTLEAIGVTHLFDAIICAEDYERGKPNPDPFLVAAKALGVPAGDCVVFEDSPLGVEAAQRAGMHCVLVPVPHRG